LDQINSWTKKWNIKKIIFYSIAFTTLTFTSCAKKYRCNCEVEHKETAQGYSYSNKFNQDTKIKSKEKSAESACSALDYENSETDQNQVKQEVIQKCDIK
jgi:hypothetical protein